MDVYLIRHAHAGSRGPGHHDIYRQLSAKGHGRAGELVDILADAAFGAIYSSPATRCVQTVEPLAASRSIEVVEHHSLWEEGSVDDVFELLEACTTAGAVLCSHGNIIPEVIETLGRRDLPVKGRGCEKGSIWVLEHDGKKFRGARYLGKKVTNLA